MKNDLKMFSAPTRTAGGKHSTLPQTTGGETARHSGKQVVKFRAALDNGHSHSAPTRLALRV